MGKITDNFNFNAIITLIILYALTACSSGGSGGGATGVTYTGNTSPAQITTANASPITANAITSDDSTTVFTAAGADNSNNRKSSDTTTTSTEGQATTAELLSFVREHLLPLAKTNMANTGNDRRTAAVIDVNETQNCDSGSLSFSGQLSDDFLGSLNFTFNNCQTDGFTANGSLTFQINAFDLNQDELSNATFTFSELTITGTGFDATTSGTVDIQESISNNSITLTLNIIVQERSSGRQFQTQNLVIVTVYDNLAFPSNFTESISGRVFDSVEGYVDITTVTPLSYSSTLLDYPDSGGELLLTGADNRQIRVIANPNNTVTLELDLNADGTFESSANFNWDDLETADGSSFS